MKKIQELYQPFAPYSKAIVVYIVGVALFFLSFLSITPEMTVEQALTMAVTGMLVYLVPNKQK